MNEDIALWNDDDKDKDKDEDESEGWEWFKEWHCIIHSYWR